MGAMHPKMAAVHAAALAFVAAIGQREAAVERCRGLARERAKLVLTAAVEQEAAAFSELANAMYDPEMLDLVCKGTVI